MSWIRYNYSCSLERRWRQPPLLKIVQGFSESLQQCIRPQSSVTSLYGRFRAEKLPYKAVTELWRLMQCCKDSAKSCSLHQAFTTVTIAEWQHLFTGKLYAFLCTISPVFWLAQQRILDSMSRLCCMSCDITSLHFCHTDINECSLRTHNCEQLCTNTPGSFTCSCRSGYTLNSDRRTCRASEFKPQIPTVYNLCML